MADIKFDLAWKDGGFCDVSALMVSVQDFALLHGDGAYDTIYIAKGRAFMLEESWQRFNESANRFRLNLDISLDDLKIIAGELLAQNGCMSTDCILSLVITRGRPTSMCDPGTARNSLMIFLKPMPVKFPRGNATVCLSSIPRVPDICIDQSSKHFAWADLTMAQFEALDWGFDLALLSSLDGYISEGYATGVCSYKDRTIFSPAKNRVDSTTITALARVAKKNSWEFCYTNITKEDLLSADGLVVCAISGLCTPVTKFETHLFDMSLDMSDKFNTWIYSEDLLFTKISHKET